jgi:hypothetical protein
MDVRKPSPPNCLCIFSRVGGTAAMGWGAIETLDLIFKNPAGRHVFDRSV